MNLEVVIMQLNIKKAILLPFSGIDWFLRLTVLSLLSFFGIIFYSQPSNIENFAIIFVLFFIIFSGYFWQFAHNEINNIYPSLPSWKLDVIKYFKQGFICSFNIFAYLVPVALYMCLLSYLLSIATKSLINPSLPPIKIFLTNYSFNVFITQVFAVYLLFIMFITPCLCANVIRFKDRPIVSFSKLFNVISNAKSEFLLAIIIFIASSKTIELISKQIQPIYLQIILVCLLLSIVYIIVFDLFVQSFILSKYRREQKDKIRYLKANNKEISAFLSEDEELVYIPEKEILDIYIIYLPIFILVFVYLIFAFIQASNNFIMFGFFAFVAIYLLVFSYQLITDNFFTKIIFTNKRLFIIRFKKVIPIEYNEVNAIYTHGETGNTYLNLKSNKNYRVSLNTLDEFKDKIKEVYPEFDNFIEIKNIFKFYFFNAKNLLLKYKNNK